MSAVHDKKISSFLRDKISLLPSVPGCYLWLKTKLADGHLKSPEDSNILYIGKSSCIKDRVQSYLSSEDYKTSFLMLEVEDIFWIATKSESEALLLESTLIKRVQPIYNIRLKDDKRYPYLCLTLGEVFPRLLITRKKLGKEHYYYGPYVNVGAARRTKQIIEKIFPIRKKRLRLPQVKPQKPCLNYHMGRCWAPCTQDVSVEEYRSMIEEIKNFLENKDHEIVRNLELQMKSYASHQEYEKAARIRNILNDLQVTLEYQQSVCSGNMDEGSLDIDILAIVEKQEKEIYPFLERKISYLSDEILENEEDTTLRIILYEIVLLKVRSGDIIKKQEFSVEPRFIRLTNSFFDEKMLEEFREEAFNLFFREYYLSNYEIPTKIYVSNKIDLVSWASILSERSQKNVELVLKEKNVNMKQKHLDLAKISDVLEYQGSYNIDLLLEIAISNAELVLEEKNIAFKRNRRKCGLEQVQDFLGLKEIPLWIECFDISNFQGKYAVGGHVVFKNGIPFKSAYRKYKIRTKETPDDPAMMYEVLVRRFQKLKTVLLQMEQKKQTLSMYIPNLIIVDGGSTQLHATLMAKEDVFCDMPTRLIEKVPHIVSLAKKEEMIYDEGGEILNLDSNLDGMCLLRHARDEAHRFSVSYHRTLRAHGMYR